MSHGATIAPHGAHSRIDSLEEYRELHKLSLEEPEKFWRAQAERLTWFHPFESVFEADPVEVDFNWYAGGKLNACFNCVDRHAETTPDKPAIIWVGNEPGETRVITFRELKYRVSQLANVLRAKGVKKGDRVCIYMPMIPEAAFAMLACARIGAAHSVVFAGFSANALRDRILDADCKVVITADEAPRGARKVALKSIVDEAVEPCSHRCAACWSRGAPARTIPMKEGRDFDLAEEMARQRSTSPIEWMDSEDPLFVLYTSGSTGKPKGVLHTTAGYLVYAAMTYQLVFDPRENEIHFCTADVGWVTGHSYIVYGPLANGVTTVMFEGVPVYPDASRLWQVADEVQANILYTAPTGVAACIASGAPATAVRHQDLRASRCACWGASASRSIQRRGPGTTTWSARSAATSSTPGGRRRRVES